MKRCSVCNLLNFDDAPSCTSCSTPFPRKKKGYLQIIRWHLLVLLLVLVMMGMLKFRSGEIFRDFGRLMSASSIGGRVEISDVRIYNDLTGKTVVEGNLTNLSETNHSDLDLEVIVYNVQDKKLGRHYHVVSNLPKARNTPFIIKIPLYKTVHHAHFTLRTKSKKELYLINRRSGPVGK